MMIAAYMNTAAFVAGQRDTLQYLQGFLVDSEPEEPAMLHCRAVSCPVFCLLQYLAALLDVVRGLLTAGPAAPLSKGSSL
jgi:hypothetical protein